MAQIKFKGNPVSTNGELPKVGSKAPCFSLVKSDLIFSQVWIRASVQHRFANSINLQPIWIIRL